MNEKYVEALESCSLESYEGYFEDLNSQGKLPDADLWTVELLPVSLKLASYALAILSCPLCSDDAKAWAREKLHTLV